MRRGRTFTINKTADSGGVSLRTGQTVLGRLLNMREGFSAQEGMTAKFESAPAFVDHRDRCKALADALKLGPDGAAEAARLRQEIEALGVHVYHDVHDMRIDEPASVVISGGEVRFRPTGAFLMMRSGGLG